MLGYLVIGASFLVMFLTSMLVGRYVITRGMIGCSAGVLPGSEISAQRGGGQNSIVGLVNNSLRVAKASEKNDHFLAVFFKIMQSRHCRCTVNGETDCRG